MNTLSRKTPPGCIIRRRERYYWKLPQSLREHFDGRQTVPLMMPGQTRGATKNKRAAESVRLQMWRDLKGSDAPQTDGDEVVESFEAHMALATSVDNAKHNAGKIRRLIRFAAGRGVAVNGLSPETIEAFMAWLKADEIGPDGEVVRPGAAANTLYNYYNAIKNFSDWAGHARRTIVTGDLLDGIPRPKQDRPHLRFLTKHQAARAWRTVRRFAPSIERHFLLALWTGARREEIPSMDWSDLFRDQTGRLWIRIRNFKTNSERPVPIAPRLGRRLVRWGMGRRGRESGPIAAPALVASTLGQHLTDLVAEHPEGMPMFGGLRAHATGNGWHLLRHTFGSWAAQAGVDIRVIKEWMGHKSIQTTMIYAAVRPSTSAELIDRL